MSKLWGHDDVNKIDSEPVDGLLGEEDSLAYKVHELERHIHNREKWFGLAGTPSGETHRGDRMAGGVAPFVLTAGNDDFGTWLQMIGSDDTPVSTGMVKFDGHRFIVSGTNSTNVFIIQVVAGESAAIAAKIAAEEFTEFPYISGSNNNDSGISDFMSSRIDAGEKIWARICCIGASGSTLSAYFGLHEYEG